MLSVLAPLRRRLYDDERGIALTEFALLTPFLIFAVLAEWEYYNYTMATQRLQVAAETVAQMFGASLAAASPTTSGDAVVTDSDIASYVSAAYFIYPDPLPAAAATGDADAALAQTVDIQITAIKMLLRSDGATYQPKTAWYGGLNRTSAFARNCDTQFIGTPANASPSPSTLPSNLIGPNPLIVVDVHMDYQPTFAASFVPTMSIAKSVYLTPRNVPFIEYAGGSLATQCGA